MKKLVNEILVDVRKKHKLTRKGLENISGFKERTIGSYERGENNPTKEYLEFICLYFGYSIDYLTQNTKSLLDVTLCTINRYQSIYNYDNKKMAELLKITIKEYEKKYYYLTKDSTNNKLNPHDYFLILEKLNINPKSAKLSLSKIEIKEHLHKDRIENLETRYDELISNGLNITSDYYASIIKQRNKPKTVTPDTQKENIPEKYKEVLELLPYAPDSFIDTIIQKLKTMKESQTL